MMGADGTQFITQGEARTTLQELFSGVHGQMVAQNAETQGLIAQLRSDVRQAIWQPRPARTNRWRPFVAIPAQPSPNLTPSWR